MLRLQPYFSTIQLVSGYLHLTEVQKLIKGELKENAGVYAFFSKSSGKLYVGSSVNLFSRFNDHLTGYNSNLLLQRSINKNSLEDFIFIILEYCEPEDLISQEQEYLDILKPDYNILKKAGSLLGYKHSDLTIAKMKVSKAGKNNPMAGKIHSQETIILMKKPKSEDTKAKMSESHKKLNKIGKYNPMGKNVFVYSFDLKTQKLILSKTFESCTESAKYFDTSVVTITKYLDKNKLYKNNWILFSSLIIENSKD